jgi:hypothetical protein
VTGDAAIVAASAPVDDKTTERIAILRVSLGVLLPIGIVIPDAKRFREVLRFDRGEKLVHAMFRWEIPTESDNNAGNATDQKSADQEIAAPLDESSVVDRCV